MKVAREHGLNSAGALTSRLRDSGGKLSQRVRSASRARGAHAHLDVDLVADVRAALAEPPASLAWDPATLMDDRQFCSGSGPSPAPPDESPEAVYPPIAAAPDGGGGSRFGHKRVAASSSSGGRCVENIAPWDPASLRDDRRLRRRPIAPTSVAGPNRDGQGGQGPYCNSSRLDSAERQVDMVLHTRRLQVLASGG